MDNRKNEFGYVGRINRVVGFAKWVVMMYAIAVTQFTGVVMEQEPTQEGVSAKAAKHRTPPYIAFKTFLTLLSELKTNGVPPQIDRSVLSRFAGGLQGQIMLALRSLDLIDGENKPKPSLQSAVGSYDTDQFPSFLAALLRKTYPYVFDLDLMAATPTMFAKAFSDATDAKEDVLRKCRTFFLHAAKDAGIQVGPRIEKAKFPRSRSAAPRKPKASKGASPKVDETSGDEVKGKGNPSQDPVLIQLLTKFPEFDPTWPNEIKAQWFEGFEKFMTKANGG